MLSIGTLSGRESGSIRLCPGGSGETDQLEAFAKGLLCKLLAISFQPSASCSYFRKNGHSAYARRYPGRYTATQWC